MDFRRLYGVPTGGRYHAARRGHLVIPVVLSGWLALIGAGFLTLFWYGTMPGTSQGKPVRWPADVAVALEPARPNLLLFAHPRCACTQATLRELARIEQACRGRVSIRMFFFLPEEEADAWQDTSLIRQAHAIPGAQIHWDHQGEMARRFGATTSGQVVLYNEAGELVFRGGITPSRAHEGANRGAESIVQHVYGIPSDDPVTAVYGCSIFSPRESE